MMRAALLTLVLGAAACSGGEMLVLRIQCDGELVIVADIAGDGIDAVPLPLGNCSATVERKAR